jgi:CheY-like chemotaxis protein
MGTEAAAINYLAYRELLKHMDLQQYGAQKLKSILEKFYSQKSSGTVYVDAELGHGDRKKACILVLKNGELIWAGPTILSNQEAAQLIGRKLKRDAVKIAIEMALPKLTNPTSARELLEKLVQLRLLTWQHIASVMYEVSVCALEQILPYPGQLRLDPAIAFDLAYGDDAQGMVWSELMATVDQRQPQWAALAGSISSMHAIPVVQPGALNKIAEPSIREHVQQYVDGQRSLVDIAEQLEKDPLAVAQSYVKWVQAGWIRFQETLYVLNVEELPAILAVDDSPIVQTAIKRALSSYYNVLLASSAKEALTLLTQKKVIMMITDVTMPEIDGLELCRTVRSMPQFRNLPVVMLTARDGMIDKLKGQIAGSTKYLTKPFAPEKLLDVVREYG